MASAWCCAAKILIQPPLWKIAALKMIVVRALLLEKVVAIAR